jgi:hypothetical protein
MREPFEKYLKQKRTVSMTQVVEYLPAKCKALSSNPDTAKKKWSDRFYSSYFSRGGRLQYRTELNSEYSKETWD